MKVEDSIPKPLPSIEELPKRCYSKKNVPSHSDISALRIVKPFFKETTVETKLKVIPQTAISAELKELFGPLIDEALSAQQNVLSSAEVKKLKNLKKDLEESQRWIQLVLDLLNELQLEQKVDSKLTQILQKVLKRQNAANV
jgi:hypothetical protein